MDTQERYEAGVSEGWLKAFVVNPDTGEEIPQVVWINEKHQTIKRFIEVDGDIHYSIEHRPCMLVHEI
jgi:hypothetical protein